jgi:hypothetical protein
MQIFSGADGIPFHRFFVDFEDRGMGVFCEEVSGMGFEEGALADAAHAGEDLDQGFEGVGFELLEIKISTMHEEIVYIGFFSIANLFFWCEGGAFGRGRMADGARSAQELEDGR